MEPAPELLDAAAFPSCGLGHRHILEIYQTKRLTLYIGEPGHCVPDLFETLRCFETELSSGDLREPPLGEIVEVGGIRGRKLASPRPMIQ